MAKYIITSPRVLAALLAAGWSPAPGWGHGIINSPKRGEEGRRPYAAQVLPPAGMTGRQARKAVAAAIAAPPPAQPMRLDVLGYMVCHQVNRGYGHGVAFTTVPGARYGAPMGYPMGRAPQRGAEWVEGRKPTPTRLGWDERAIVRAVLTQDGQVVIEPGRETRQTSLPDQPPGDYCGYCGAYNGLNGEWRCGFDCCLCGGN